MDDTVNQRKEQRAIGQPSYGTIPPKGDPQACVTQDETGAHGNTDYAARHGTQESYRMDPIFRSSAGGSTVHRRVRRAAEKLRGAGVQDECFRGRCETPPPRGVQQNG